MCVGINLDEAKNLDTQLTSHPIFMIRLQEKPNILYFF